MFLWFYEKLSRQTFVAFARQNFIGQKCVAPWPFDRSNLISSIFDLKWKYDQNETHSVVCTFNNATVIFHSTNVHHWNKAHAILAINVCKCVDIQRVWKVTGQRFGFDLFAFFPRSASASSSSKSLCPRVSVKCTTAIATTTALRQAIHKVKFPFLTYPPFPWNSQ